MSASPAIKGNLAEPHSNAAVSDRNELILNIQDHNIPNSASALTLFGKMEI